MYTLSWKQRYGRRCKKDECVRNKKYARGKNFFLPLCRLVNRNSIPGPLSKLFKDPLCFCDPEYRWWWGFEGSACGDVHTCPHPSATRVRTPGIAALSPLFTGGGHLSSWMRLCPVFRGVPQDLFLKLRLLMSN